MTKLAAFASAPLIEGKLDERAFFIVKPPTRLMIVIDPDRPYDSPASVEEERIKIFKEIIAVVRAQGVEPEYEDIDSLVSITTWPESCFEFAHFTSGELAVALLRMHRECGGLDEEALTRALDLQRENHQDIGHVWTNWWPPQPNKKRLARELWPVLRERLDRAASDPNVPLPPIAEALVRAFRSTAMRPRGRFVIRGVSLVESHE